MPRRQVWLIVLGAVFIIVRCATMMPRDFTTDEERSFGAALLTFDPYGHQPPPPSYPAYVAAGKFLHFFFRRPLPALLALSILSAVAGFALFAVSFSRILGWSGIVAALAIYVSPPVRFLCSHPTPEPFAFALFAGALLLWLRGDWRFAALAGLAIAARPQMVFAVMAFFALSTLAPRERGEGQQRFAHLLPAVAGRRATWFVLTLVACFAPVISNVRFERMSIFFASMQFGHGAPVRDFLLQPWWKATAIVLLMALMGLIRKPVIPLMAYTVAHLVYASTAGASNESVRPWVPSLIGIAFFAAAAVGRYHRQSAEADDLARHPDVQRGGEH